MATSWDIATAAAADIAASPLSDGKLKPVVQVQPRLDLADLKDQTLVIVCPVEIDPITILARASRQIDYRIDVGLRRQLPDGEDAEGATARAMLQLCEALALYLAGRRLSGGEAICVGVQAVLVDRDALRDERCYAGLIRCTYRVVT